MDSAQQLVVLAVWLVGTLAVTLDKNVTRINAVLQKSQRKHVKELLVVM